jgi:hypothetical protein
MMWTCPHCRCERVRWNPRLYTEAELRQLRGPSLPERGRAIVRTHRGWAMDHRVRCPDCRRSFFPGDALMAGLSVESAAASQRRSGPGDRSALPG